MKTLTELPNRIVHIRDDLEAQSFLLALGILDKLPKFPKISGDITLAQSGGEVINTVGVAHFTHDTHWILAFRLHGMADEKENGFDVWAWPKNKWPRSVIQDVIDRQNLGAPIEQKDFGIGDTPQS